MPTPVADVATTAGENVTTAIRADLKEFKAEINARVDGVAGSIQSLQREIASLRWMIGVGFTLLSIFLAFSTFLRSMSPVQIQRRFSAAARAAGIEARVTAHSGRVGLASELTARGASTTEVMLAGNWKTARMVAHYSAGATAERGAVRKYL